MISDTPTQTIPLHTDQHGAIRIGDSRVLLELVIHAFYLGETPEGIVESYPSLTLADVYSVIGYYLVHQDEVDAYVDARSVRVDAALAQFDSRRTPESRAFRDKLRQRKFA